MTADGLEIVPYYVLEYSDWVQVVAIDTAEHVILVEQYRHGRGRVAGTSGRSNGPTDADPVFAAARELREKTDYQALVWRYAGRLAPKPASHDNLCHVVVAPDVHFQQAAMDEPFERLRVVRMPVSEVLDLTMRGGNVQAMHVASLLVGVSAAGRLNCAVLRPRQRRVQF